MTEIRVFLNEGKDHFFGFKSEFGTPDELKLAATFDLPDELVAKLSNGKPIAALEHVFEQLNVGGDLVPATDWTEEYRANRNRSLSVGDVVQIGEAAYTVARFGWDRITTDDFRAALNGVTA